MFSAIIFDMDGLLIDSEPIWRDAQVEVFGALGVPLTHADCAKTIGLRIDALVRQWYQEHPWTSLSVEEAEEKLVNRVIELVLTQGIPKPGALELVRFFEQKGLPLAVASSSYSRIIRAAIERLGIGSSLRLFHSAEVEPHGKPHPAVYLSTAVRLGVEPSHCLAFEDSPAGVAAAKAAGMTCVCVPDEVVDRSNVTQADLILESLTEFDESLFQSLEQKLFSPSAV